MVRGLKSARLEGPSYILSPMHDWIREAAALLRGSRLGQQWVDPRPVAGHLAAMHPSVHRGLGAEVVPETSSGLPGYVHWQRVVADRGLAQEGLVGLGDEATLRQRAQDRGLPVDHKQLARLEYYTALLAGPPLVLDAVDVRLRRREGDVAHLHIVLDKVEADGRFLRVSVLVALRGSQGLVRLSDDLVGSTQGLRDLIFRQASLDIERLWVALADQPGLAVERLEKGILGPVVARGAGPWPVAEPVLCCPLEVAALDLAADHDGDPLAPASEPLRAARAHYGFKVSRERRFVVPSAGEGGLKQWCRSVGRPSVVRGVAV